MGCCNSTEAIPPLVQFGHNPATPCSAITVDLLNVYKSRIECYLKYGLWFNISSSEEEMNAANAHIDQMVERKLIDPNDCTGIESIVLIRMLVDRIIKLGACL